ncbi:Uncharacterised protein [Klebsiella pneumoniae]|nr:Uncharacterised protein [Klebsiella pneumoniae]
MNKKYPNHRFVLGYHNDKKEHPHVHVVFRIRDNDGKRADIRKKDLREIRTGFCEELKMKGYDVKATHKQQHGLNQSIKDAHKQRQNDRRAFMRLLMLATTIIRTIKPNQSSIS